MSTECTCIALRTVSRKITSLYDEALAPFGITIAQYSLLRRIAKVGAPSVTELGRLAELDRSTVGRNVRLLDRMGLVELTPGEDQREVQVCLSAAGQAMLDATLDPWREAQRTVEAKIGRETAAMLRSLAASL